MKTLKNALFLVLVTTFLMSCGGETTENTTDSTAEPTTTENTEGTTTETSAPVDNIEDASGKITDAVVQQACDCQEGARQADGTIDFPKVGECMGGKTKIQFVADLLGADASEKDRADAERVLTEKMNVKCPR